MRCFIGIFLPEEIRDILIKTQEQVGHECAKIKWLSKKNLHISLKFLGELDEEKLKLTREALGNVKSRKFKVNLADLGWFPNDEKIGVIWIDLYPRKEILELHGDIELRLGSLFKKDDKFTVHLTLGRVKQIKKKKRFLEMLNGIKINQTEFNIDEFCLIKSTLTKDGPIYTLLEKYALE